MKYVSIDNIKCIESEYKFLIGGRSNGKSTSVSKFVVENFHGENNHPKKSQFILLKRRFSQTLEMKSWFSEYVNRYIEDKYKKEILYDNGEFYLRNEDGTLELIGFCLYLSGADRYKSRQYDHVTDIVFEEFIPTSTLDYIENEIDLFNSIMSTVGRKRNLTCWFIGNTITIHNPYFELFNIDFAKLKLEQGHYITVNASNEYEEPARVTIYYTEMSYELQCEIPRYARIGRNEIAVTGLFTRTQDVLAFSDIEYRTIKHCFDVYSDSKAFSVWVFTKTSGSIYISELKNPKNIIDTSKPFLTDEMFRLFPAFPKTCNALTLANWTRFLKKFTPFVSNVLYENDTVKFHFARFI